MNELKVYEQLVSIVLKDWTVITTEHSLKTISDLLNKNDFVVIGKKWFNKYEVKTFEEYNPSSIECFIYSQTKDVAEILQEIVKERKQKWFKINGISHLLEIYSSRGKEIENT